MCHGLEWAPCRYRWTQRRERIEKLLHACTDGHVRGSSMKITVKLFATFRIGRFEAQECDYTDDITVADIVGKLGIPEKDLGIMLVNRRHVGLGHQPIDGDVLAIFPLLGGG